jgi:hypothetical protein
VEAGLPANGDAQCVRPALFAGKPAPTVMSKVHNLRFRFTIAAPAQE